jgi:hypothetical protein
MKFVANCTLECEVKASKHLSSFSVLREKGPGCFNEYLCVNCGDIIAVLFLGFTLCIKFVGRSGKILDIV